MSDATRVHEDRRTGPIRQAVVLAGGRGTRLGTLTAETPKPLLDVGGRPFLDWVVHNLARQGVETVVLTIGYRADAFDAWVAGARADVSVRTFVEEEPLGTGGALPLLAPELDEWFYVLNGDTLFDAPLAALAALRADPGTSAALALRSVDDVARYGEVRLEGRRVTAFAEKGRSGPGWINGGVYALSRDAVAGLTSPCSIETDLMPALAREGRLGGLPSDGFFIDIGIPSTFEEAQRSVPAWWARTTGE